jgi:hypothetical protein
MRLPVFAGVNILAPAACGEMLAPRIPLEAEEPLVAGARGLKAGESALKRFLVLCQVLTTWSGPMAQCGMHAKRREQYLSFWAC